MKKNTTKTDVLFLIEKGSKTEVFAYFPNEVHNSFTSPAGQTITSYMSYSHVGQHTACNVAYTSQCKKAKQSQYKDLKEELESIGYDLNVLN